ncbi:MAG: sensor histidine kinase [Nitrospirae bacterium]|nr:sensor histidine kinase [Nitrospirota bacterium]
MQNNGFNQLPDHLQNEAYLRGVLLDSFSCAALVLKKHTREIVECNRYAKQLGAEVGRACFESLFKADRPCHFCRADAVWETSERQDIEVENAGKSWRCIWIPFSDDLFLHYLSDIAERKKHEEQIISALTEKEMLLHEMSHRVKNNLQVLTSVMGLQANVSKNDEANNILKEAQNRIRSMAVVHEMLYKTKNLSYLNCGDYIHKLAKTLLQAEKGETAYKIRTVFNLQEVMLSVDRATLLGLIFNELITNVLKYAFSADRDRELKIDLTKDGNTCTLSVKDNGVGLPQGFDHRNTGTLGLTLVSGLVKQLKGEFKMSSDNGTKAVVTFKLSEKDGDLN